VLKRPRNYTIWLILLVCLFVVGLALALTGDLGQAEGPLLRLLLPLQEGSSRIGQGVSDAIQTARDLRDLRERNEQLTQLVNELAVENVRLNELDAENAILRDLLDYVDASLGSDFKATEIRTRVVGWEPGNLLQYIMLSAGAEDGLAVGMPVVTERGLVGRIDEVFPRSARVRLIIDGDSSVNALVQRTRATGIVKGVAGRQLVLDYLPQEGDVVAVGDIVLTSGLGGGFPRRLVIGQVVEVVQKDYEIFQQAIIRPTVDFDRLEIVLVITNFSPLSSETGAN
jgi:rod shape-determining protein MreC